MVQILTNNEGTSLRDSLAAQYKLNRTAILAGNRANQENYTNDPSQLQNSEFLFPDRSISLNKISASFPAQYDAVVTKDHVLGNTLISYDSLIFYNIASVIDYAISKNKSSFSLFIQDGIYNETARFGDGDISLTIIGASKTGTIINWTALTTGNSCVLPGQNGLINNIQLISKVQNKDVINESSLDISGTLINDCILGVDVASSTSSTIIWSLGVGVVISKVSFVVRLGVIARCIGVSVLDEALTISNCFAVSGGGGVGAFLEIDSTTTINGLNFLNNETSKEGGVSVGVWLKASGTALSASGVNNITGNLFYNCATGILLEGDFATQTTNLIQANSFLICTDAIKATNCSCIIANNYCRTSTFGVTTGFTLDATNTREYLRIISNNNINAPSNQGGVCIQIGTSGSSVNNSIVIEGNTIIHRRVSSAGISISGTGNFIVTNSNRFSIGTDSGAGGVSISAGTINDCVFDGNSCLNGTASGRMISAAAADRNIITSNRTIGGSATFLSFATGTNIVANNLAT